MKDHPTKINKSQKLQFRLTDTKHVQKKNGANSKAGGDGQRTNSSKEREYGVRSGGRITVSIIEANHLRSMWQSNSDVGGGHNRSPLFHAPEKNGRKRRHYKMQNK